MMTYVQDVESGETKVTIKGNAYEVANYIDKHLELPKYPKLADEYYGVAKCSSEDSFDYEVGKDLALKRSMEHRNKAFRSAIIAWQAEIIRRIQAVSPETFHEALKKTE